MSNHDDDDEYLMVPVPKSQLRAVYALLASPPTEQGARAHSGEVAEEAVEVYNQGAWTATDVGRLEAEVTNAAMRAFLSRLAEQAPRSLTFKEAVEATGLGANLLRAQFGSLSKITKRLFGAVTWPMAVRYRESGEAIYSMDPKIAKWWLDAADRSS